MKKLLIFAVAALTMTPLLIGCSGKSDGDTDSGFGEYVEYSDFGAVGDGKADDFDAIKRTHEYANEHGVAVKADKDAKYYIKPVEDTVTVKTNVDWRNASFIIDDKSAEQDSSVRRFPIFDVKPDTAPEPIPVPSGYSLKAGQGNVGMMGTTFKKGVMLAIVNDYHKDFIRHGMSGDVGWSRQEVILVDKDGNVDPSTPIQRDFGAVTSMVAYSIDEKPLVIKGGKFTTVANDDTLTELYYERGIKVERSNTTVENVKHYVTDEGENSSPYNGFFRANYANNVVFKNCVMTGHKLYKNGTYDTRLFNSNDVKYIGCTQANDHTDPKYWGIMCSDFCKNLYMDGCKLSRFDAHMGVYNATIINSDIGQHISLTGGGTLRIENVTRRCVKDSTFFNRFVTLREDYGSFFNGDIIIKNSTLYTSRGINYVVAASWYDFDFGYACRFPTTITLDNVQMVYNDDVEGYKHPCLYVFSHITKTDTLEAAKASKNPPVLTEKVIIKNNKTPFRMTANRTGWFVDTIMM